MDLVGRWRKVSDEPCAGQYPDEIEFEQATYLGHKGPAQRFIVWDAGIYRVTGSEEVLISIATDELVPYRFRLEGDRVTFVDREGCSFSYRRMG